MNDMISVSIFDFEFDVFLLHPLNYFELLCIHTVNKSIIIRVAILCNIIILVINIIRMFCLLQPWLR